MTYFKEKATFIAVTGDNYLKIFFSIILSGTIAFYTYFYSLAPGLIQFGDSPKFQFIGYVYGIPHPTGYPLYIIISAIFVRIFTGDVAYLTNLLSAIFATAAVILVNVSVIRLTKSVLYAVVVSALLTVSPVFWSQAIIAEVYTLHAFFVALLFWWVIIWEDTQKTRYLFLAWTTLCIGLGNHATLIFFAMAFGIYILLYYGRYVLMIRRNLLIFILISLIVPIQYLLLYIWSLQKPLYSELEAGSLAEYLVFLSGDGFQSRFFARNFFDGVAIFQEVIISNISIIGIGLAFVGLLCLFAKKKLLVFFILSLLAYLGFALTYAINDIIVYFIPPIIIFVLLAGLGLYKVENEAQRFFSQKVTRIITVLIACSLLPFIVHNYSANSHLGDWFLENQNTNNLRTQLKAIPPNSTVFTPANRDWWRVLYLKYVEGMVPTSSVEKNEQALSFDRPVFAVKPDFDPSVYHVQVTYLGDSLIQLLDSMSYSDVVIITISEFDSTKNSPQIWAMLEQYGLYWAPLQTGQDIILFGKKDGENNGWISLVPPQTISVRKGEKLPQTDIYSPASLIISNQPESTGLIIKVNNHVVLDPRARFGIILLTSAGDIKAAGAIDLERMLVNEIPLYQISKRKK